VRRRSAPSHDVFVVDAPSAALRFREWSIDEHVCRDRDWPGDLAEVRDAAARHFGTLPRPRAVALASALDRVTPTHIVFGVPLAGGSASPRTLAPPCPADEDAMLLVRVDLAWVRSSLLPMLVERHFGDAGSSEFNVAVVARDGSEVIVAIPPSDVAWTRAAAPDAAPAVHPQGRRARRGSPATMTATTTTARTMPVAARLPAM
jgi:hypothetical protein